MKAIFKKTVIIVLSIILTFWIVSATKNIYLYFNYERGNEALIKIEGQPNEIIGKWKGTFDTYQCGMDERHILEYHFISDSTGIHTYKFYSKKINGRIAYDYSWEAILPFDKNESREYQYKVFIDSLYIIHFPDSNSFWQDTVYAQYKISNDSLYIDSKKQDYRYTTEPVWGMMFSEENIDFIRVFNMYWDAYDLFHRIKRNF